jgi:MurE/MurF fusion protein
MFLGNLLKSINKKYKDIPIKGIAFNSKEVKKNYIFFAIDGNKISGTKFISEAIRKGANIIISKKSAKYKSSKIPIILVKDSREALAEACSKFYKQKPSNIIAVTGTNGKSSVADFFYQLLNLNKIPVASIGTLGVKYKNYRKKTSLTSIDCLSLHKNLQNIKKNKVDNVILEASSHGLKQKRLNSLDIKIGIFTNLSHDHLDYHKNMKDYLESKMYLFKNLLNNKSKIITDAENKEFKLIKSISKNKKIKKITIGLNSGDIKILDNKYKGDLQIIKILYDSKIFIIKVPLIGFFQIKNLFMAILAASALGIENKKIFNKLDKIKPVIGRLELIKTPKNYSKIIVDFCHTPDALEQSLIAIKKQFQKDIILLFGCGGDRDKRKRLIMGKIAKKYCKKIFVTDDNPRNESPKKIRDMIIKGCGKKAINIGNRKKAILSAMKVLKPNEVLLVAGKGHEAIQSYGKKVIKFSDQKTIRTILKSKSFYIKKKSWSSCIIKEAFNNKVKNLNYKGVSINTKTIRKNNIFFALSGKKLDGHKFAKEAIQKGAKACVVSKKISSIPAKKIIRVKNTFFSLNNLGKVTRNNSLAEIIGITGSVGKTTLKNLTSFMLKHYGNVYQSPYSYNNKFGVPISLSNLKRNTDYGVFEIGMDKMGEIDRLSKIVKPSIGVITNISEAHIKNFKNLKDIAKAKGEIIYNIKSGGDLVLNKDEKFYNFFHKIASKRKINIISFSAKKKADIFLNKIEKGKKYYRAIITIKNKKLLFNIRHSNKNFVINVLASISILYALNLDLKKLRNKLVNFSIPEGRGDIVVVKKFGKKFKFIDESYNANPLSMISAIENMSNYKVKNNSSKLALLGDMLELGQKSNILHKKISKAINKSKIDKVFVYGKHIKTTFAFLSERKKGKIFNNLQEAHNYFNKIIRNNDLLMIKGSNATGLKEFSKNIKKGQTSVI